MVVFRRAPRAFGLDVLARAQGDLGVTAAGDPARVTQMLANYGIHSPTDWCAAALGTWILEAAHADGIKPPIAGSAGALATMVQFQAVGTWLGAGALPSVGMVPVWSRGDTGSGLGHIGIVSAVLGGGAFRAISGNDVGAAVLETTHPAGASTLLGFGYFPQVVG